MWTIAGNGEKTIVNDARLASRLFRLRASPAICKQTRRKIRGEIGQGKPGVGKLIYKARPTVIPVRMIGTEDVLGVGKIIPRAFQSVRIIIGKPLDLTEILDMPLPDDEGGEMAFYKEISHIVIDAIKALTPKK